jgi:hypothetical protein
VAKSVESRIGIGGRQGRIREAGDDVQQIAGGRRQEVENVRQIVE